jgi:hypothetical protein
MLNLGRGNLTRIVRDIDMQIQKMLSEQHIYSKPRLHFFLFYCS